MLKVQNPIGGIGIKNCKQYPRVTIQKRSWRPNSDLCDECQDLERALMRKAAIV